MALTHERVLRTPEGASTDIRYWIDPKEIEPDAQKQIHATASMPFVKAVAVMPDVHLGKGSTVGTVVATQGAVMPACVGVDIGCGMIAVRTSLVPSDVKPHLQRIREGIERRIPVGIGQHGQNSRILPSAEQRIQTLKDMSAKSKFAQDLCKFDKNWPNALGTLGGGNHFIEICIGRGAARWQNVCSAFGASTEPFWDTDHRTPEEVWVILHSGSRGIGNKIGTFWTQEAQRMARKYRYDAWLPNVDLAYLPEKTEEFWRYMEDLHWAQEFARLNRDEMMDRVLHELMYTVCGGPELVPNETKCPEEWCGTHGYDLVSPKIEIERINCHHNYVSREHYGDDNLIITRKGAIEAREGTRALIPGSMGARSYIVEGKGNEFSFNSAPHGAGRRMSRRAARDKYTVEDMAVRMEGIEARLRPQILDEIPDAYKDIDVVMENAAELVRPTYILKQMISVKGD